MWKEIGNFNPTIPQNVSPKIYFELSFFLQNIIKLFPNPSNGNVSLQFNEMPKGNLEISVTDVTGKIVLTHKIVAVNSSPQFNLDVKNGIYFVKITNQDKTIIKKMVVQQ